MPSRAVESDGGRFSVSTLRAFVRHVVMTPYAVLVWVLVFFPWLIAPGHIEPDTKLDLIVSPWRYLERGLSAWSGHSGFGELQNQAYGYLFPMGTFFELGYLLGMPAWGIQRLWWGLMLVVGGLGAALLGRVALRLGPFGACICGLAYALSPRVLTLLAQLSVEAWPGMLLPWFILLVIRHQRGRTTTLRFGVEIAALTVCLGGVNATASLVPLGGAFCYALARRIPVRSLGALVLGGLMGAAWWLGPLVVLGKYAYPFMDYIETSHITTAVTSTPGVLRGASDWVAYIIDASGHPVWQSGWVIAQDTTSIVGALVLAGVGIMMLTGRHFGPWRAMLIIGVLAVGSAYVGAVHGPFAAPLRNMLDGPLAALRNVHKFDPLIRLPLALGLGYAVTRMTSAWEARPRTAAVPPDNTKNPPPSTENVALVYAKRPLTLGAVTLVALAASAMPFWQGRLGDPGAPTAVPASVARAAHVIDAQARQDGGATLVLPSSRSATFTWGTYTDEPLAAFATSPVAYRASAPLVAPGAIRLMDRADADLAANRDIEPLMRTLLAAGVRRIVIRSGATPADRAMDAAHDVQVLSAHGTMFSSHHHIASDGASFDIFTLAGNAAAPSGASMGVLGAPESSITLAGAGVSPQTPLIIGKPGWITDDARKHAYNNGLPAALAYGPTLPASSRDDARIGAKDLTYPGRDASLVTERYVGFDTLSGDSLANPFAAGYMGPGAGPSSALDDSLATAWLTPAHQPSSLTLGWRTGSRAFTFSLAMTALDGGQLGSTSVSADGKPLASHSGAWRVPAGTYHLSITPHATNNSGEIGITEIQANTPLRALSALPGIVHPVSSGIVMTQQLTRGPAGALRGEDDGTWHRLLIAATDGTMHVTLTGTPSCARSTLRVNESLQHLQGCSGTIRLRTGENTLTISGTTRATLTPTSASARSALGLNDGTPPGPIVQTLFSGANAGWRGTVNARIVQPLTIDGWRQGFITRHNPDVRFTPSATNTLALAAGGILAAFALIAVALPWGRRNAPLNSETFPAPTATSTKHQVAPTQPTPITPDATHHVLRKNTSLLVALALAVILTGWWSIPLTLLTLALPQRHRPLTAGAALAACGPVLAGFGVVAHGSAGAFWGQLLGTWALMLMLCARWRAPAAPKAAQRTSNSARQSNN